MISDDKAQVWTLSATNHLVCWSTSSYLPLLNVGLRNSLATSLSASCLLACNNQLWLAVGDRLVAVSKSQPRRRQHMLTVRDNHDNGANQTPSAAITRNLNEQTVEQRLDDLATRVARLAVTAGLEAVLAQSKADQSATIAVLDSQVDILCLGVANELWCCSKSTPCLQIIDIEQHQRILTWVVEESGLHQLLAAGTAMWAAAPSGSLYAWHMKSKEPLLRLTLHQSAISCLALSPCETYLLTCSGDPAPQLLVHSVWTHLDCLDNCGLISERMLVTDTDAAGPPAEPEAVVRRAALDESANQPLLRMTAEYDHYGFRRSVVDVSSRHRTVTTYHACHFYQLTAPRSHRRLHCNYIWSKWTKPRLSTRPSTCLCDAYLHHRPHLRLFYTPVGKHTSWSWSKSRSLVCLQVLRHAPCFTRAFRDNTVNRCEHVWCG
jgi:hypothetical protein